MSIKEILVNYHQALLQGLGMTLFLWGFAMILGLLLGFVLGFSSYYYQKRIGYFVTVFSTIFSSIPFLVLLFRVYFPLQHVLQVQRSGVEVALFCLTLLNVVLTTEVVTKTLKQIPQQYIVTAESLGLSYKTITKKIILPLLFIRSIGPLIFVQIVILHTTLFTSFINVAELFRQIQRINALVYKPIELYSILAFIFFCISLPLYFLGSHYLQKGKNVFSQRV